MKLCNAFVYQLKEWRIIKHIHRIPIGNADFDRQ